MLELKLRGIQNERKIITMLVEEMKKARAQASIFSTSQGEDIEGEYTYPIPSSNLTTSPDSETTIKLELWQEIEALVFGINIGQPVFTASPSLEVAVIND